jgi:hypothetical protein
MRVNVDGDERIQIEHFSPQASRSAGSSDG